MLYCDSAATTLILHDVIKQFNNYASSQYANPSASHDLGKKAAEALSDCNKKFAQMIGALEPEIIWTSGATESNNIVISSFVKNHLGQEEVAYIFYHPLSHASLIEPLKEFERNKQVVVTEIPYLVDKAQIDIKFLVEEVKNPDQTIILLPYGNNEIGLIDDYTELAQWAKASKIWIHFDAAQSLGKIKIDLKNLPCHSMSFSGHKLGAPVGIGALFIRMRPRRAYYPMLRGGDQQEGRRAGTIPLCLIQCFVTALDYWLNNNTGLQLSKYQKKIINHLTSLSKYGVNIFLFENMLPHIVTFMISIKNEEKISVFNQKVACSKGSACSSHAAKGSHQFNYLGYSIEDQTNIYRLSIGPDWTEEKNNQLLKELTNLIGD